MEKEELHTENYPLQKIDETQELLLKEIKSLQETVKKLETDIEDIKYFTPQPRTIIDKELVGTLGMILLGALVIIGIFF